jgi:hypothetical protein
MSESLIQFLPDFTSPGTMMQVGHGTYRAVEVDPESAAREQHRAAWLAHQAKVDAEAELARRIDARVSEFVDALPHTAVDPRGKLLEQLGHLNTARRRSLDSHRRREATAEAARANHAASVALAELDAAVAESLQSWLRHGGDQPSKRADERAQLCDTIMVTEIDGALADAAQFEADVAEAICDRLSEGLPALRCALLVAEARPVFEELDQLADEMRSVVRRLAALGHVTGVNPGSLAVTLPPLPWLQESFTITAKDAPEAVAHWRAELSRLETDPKAKVRMPPNG